MNYIIDFFNNNIVAKIFLDAYFAIIIISFVLYIVFKFKKALNLLIIGLALMLIYYSVTTETTFFALLWPNLTTPSTKAKSV